MGGHSLPLAHVGTLPSIPFELPCGATLHECPQLLVSRQWGLHCIVLQYPIPWGRDMQQKLGEGGSPDSSAAIIAGLIGAVAASCVTPYGPYAAYRPQLDNSILSDMSYSSPFKRGGKKKSSNLPTCYALLNSCS